MTPNQQCQSTEGTNAQFLYWKWIPMLNLTLLLFNSNKLSAIVHCNLTKKTDSQPYQTSKMLCSVRWTESLIQRYKVFYRLSIYLSPPTLVHILLTWQETGRSLAKIIGLVLSAWIPLIASRRLQVTQYCSLITALVVHGCPIVVGGDLNVHVEDPSDASAARLSDLFHAMDEAARDAAHTPGRRHARPHRHVLWLQRRRPQRGSTGRCVWSQPHHV